MTNKEWLLSLTNNELYIFMILVGAYIDEWLNDIKE